MHTQPQRKKQRLEDYKPPFYTTKHLELGFLLDSDNTIVSSEFVVTPSTKARSSFGQGEDTQNLFLDGVNLQLLNLQLDGVELESFEYNLTPKGLEILKPILKPTRINIINSIKPISNSELLGLYQSSGIYCTQNEPEGFRRITYFFDRPDILTTYLVRITADSRIPYLLANGNLIDSGINDSGKRFAVWEDPFPKPTYLFALIAGDLEKRSDSYTTLTGRTISLEIFTNLGNAQYAGFAMESLKHAMKWDEEVFHREYDLDTYMIVAVDDFNMGAMENKGLNVFNSKLVLASEETATDSIFEDILSVVAHEYFHNWTGNRITLRDWFQLTLKEGLTVFRDQLFSQDMIGEGVKRIDDVDFLRNYQFPEDAGKLSHPIQPKEFLDIDNFYTRTVYEKGAEVIRMIYSIVGRDSFIKALDAYFLAYDGMAITTEEFVSIFEKTLGVDLKTFRNWYHRKGTPHIEIHEEFNEEKGEYTIHWRDRYHSIQKMDLHFPVLYSLHKDTHNSGSQLETEGIFHWKGEMGSEVFQNCKKRPVVSLFQNFSAPVVWEWARPTEDLYYLWVHDKDPFTRWNSGLQIKLNEVERLSVGSDLQVEAILIDSYRNLLSSIPSEWENIRLYSYLIQLPGLTAATNQQSTYRIQECFQSIDIIKTAISNSLMKEWLSIYQDYRERTRKISSSRLEASALRLFKNTVLSYLSRDYELVYDQFSESSNLTDKIAALSLLSHENSKYRDIALEEFAREWKANPLVMDYWLSIQAGSFREDTLENVKQLKKSDYFDIRNPNRVSSLLGGFARNRLRFHQKDGSGYQFIVDCILELDGINSQSSSRLAKNFTDFAKLPSENQSTLKQILAPLVENKNLSDLLYEVVQSIQS